MSIKQSILTLCLFIGVSFSAYAGVGKVVWRANYGSYPIFTSCALPIGTHFDPSSKAWGAPCVGRSEEGVKYVDVGCAAGTCWVSECRVGRCSPSDPVTNTDVMKYSPVASCPDGQVLNPDTGVCELPPEPFCSRPDTVKQMNDFAQSCSAQGDNFQANIVCRDEGEYLSMSCDSISPPDECTPDSPDWPSCKPPTECTPDMPEYPSCCDETNNYCDNPPPEECTIFSPNWPDCAGGDDIDPDTGDGLGDPDKPDGGGTGDPDPDKPEPDVEDNSEALGAISDLNKDMNKQLTAINNDLNKNHAESKSALDALKASIDLNTDTIVDGANHLQGVIEGQTKTLTDIGNGTNDLLTSANHLLENGFGDLTRGLSSLQQTNENGFKGVIEGLEDLSNKEVNLGGYSIEGLYSTADYNNLISDVNNLKEEYRTVVNQFKNYFNFSTNVNSGDFNSHDLSLNWHGTAINQTNQVMSSLRDNAGIISAVVLFCFGIAGIRVVAGSL